VTFLEEKLFTETEQAAFSTLYFDEKIMEKQNEQIFKKKKPTPFLNEPKEYDLIRYKQDLSVYEISDMDLKDTYYDFTSEMFPI